MFIAHRSIINHIGRIVSRIVREEADAPSYVLLQRIDSRASPSPRRVDSETAPFLAPYRKEINVKPTMCSFGAVTYPLVDYKQDYDKCLLVFSGHRPSSASRTFHAASMRVHLGHGEMVPSRGGIGLPAATLAEVMQPSASAYGAEVEEEVVREELDAETRFFDAFDYGLKVIKALCVPTKPCIK